MELLTNESPTFLLISSLEDENTEVETNIFVSLLKVAKAQQDDLPWF